MTLSGRSTGSPAASLVRLLLALALGLIVVACAATPAAPSTGSSAPIAAATPSPAAASPGTATSSTPATPAASPVASPTAAAVIDEPLAGPWRVRRVLSDADRELFLPGAAFSDDQYRITPDCAAEPCPSIEVSATPAGRAGPVTTTVLQRDGDRYASAAVALADVPCRNAAGDQIPGGATSTSTIRLWLATVQPAGTAVKTTSLQGVVELGLEPTAIGVAAGCEGRVATYDLTGVRGAVAIVGSVRASSDIPAGVATAPLPEIDASIRGAEMAYFDVEGTTVDELIESVGRGALRACGGIDYEWLDGDTTPSACTITGFPQFGSEIEETLGADGACRIEADPNVSFVIHIPRWSGPERVPAVLIDWWRATVRFIRDHEAGHVRISQDHAVGLEERLDGAPCDAAERIVQNWAAALGDAQEFYDRREYVKPWPEAPVGW